MLSHSRRLLQSAHRGLSTIQSRAFSTAKVMTELDYFNVCDLRVGKIVECVECPDSEKLFIEKVDIGEEELREIGSGVRPIVPVEEMLKADSLIVVFANLKPRKLAHIMS
mmetsp:Transcript_3459/g.5883  ORF Transcript_3459/g.5883 Transcript_3459/m.5883 type:complete len:110 (+) Transcript_3459:4-333(+)